MLTAIELENFKAFGERNRIELAPITLIFGENSAGKKSIIQALNLLKQTRETRDKGALLLPRTDRGIVELGGFQELVFDHDLKRNVSIRVDMIADQQRGRPRKAQPDSIMGGVLASLLRRFVCGTNRGAVQGKLTQCPRTVVAKPNASAPRGNPEKRIPNLP